MYLTLPSWGPSGETVYERTYQRRKADGSKETWAETVDRVIAGNLGLVYGDREAWSADVKLEYSKLYRYMFSHRILPAGRHLWASGVPGRQYLFNCHVSGWTDRFSDHFEFSFLRLMEGGGVGANYGSKYLAPYGAPRRRLNVHVVCDPAHPDYAKMRAAGVLSSDYSHEWTGAFPVEDSREGWSRALVDLLDTYMTDDTVKHMHRVYDVSRVRAEGQPLRTFGGSASGPEPLARMLVDVGVVMNGAVDTDHVTPVQAMEIDHAIAACVVAGGNRRSARMAMVPWDDPYVFDFIACKRDTGKHWTTNISVEIDDRFLDQVREAQEAPDNVCRDMRAWMVLHAIAEGMLSNGEPGLWNSSLSNVGEPNPVICTNPCGEIALQEWENCNLGHVNLDAFARSGADSRCPDTASLLEAHRLVTRFLIRATYGDVTDPKQAEVLARNRRIGVGHFGVQGYLAKSGVKFTEAPENLDFQWLLDRCYRAVREEARKYAFELRIPEPVKVTTVAPTGTIAKMPGRTEGIHPVYARYFIRRMRFSSVDPQQAAKVEQFRAQGYQVELDLSAANTWVVSFPTKESLVEEVEAMGLDATALVESADEIPLERMLAFQALYQEWYADNAVSFTVNVPVGAVSVADLMTALTDALPNLKGTTVMPDGSRPQAPYERLTQAEYETLTGPKDVADSVDEDCFNGACPVR